MSKSAAARDTLLDLTITTVSERGFDDVSLRDIARRAGGSTAMIFYNFSGKAELIDAALDHAVAREAADHQALLAQIDSLISGHLSFADFLATYIAQRVHNSTGRFLSETLVKVHQFPHARATLQSWHKQRIAFWQKILERFAGPAALPGIIADYAAMEEIYAYALSDQTRYRLLLHETCRALTASSFHDGRAAPASGMVSRTLDIQPYSAVRQQAADAPAMRQHLLDHAVRIIRQHGAGALNQRALAKQAEVSSSMIAYHFRDMKSFLTEAIWSALVQGIPGALDPDNAAAIFPSTMPAWLSTLNTMMQPPIGDAPAGFYTGFAQITGEASLLARADPTLVPLMAYLRGLEGWGTYRVSSTIRAEGGLIDRDHAAAFGVWIKAEALLRRAGISDPDQNRARLDAAAATIFPVRA